jgi:lysophospholipase L1-like esterase
MINRIYFGIFLWLCWFEPKAQTVYYNANEFPLYGKCEVGLGDRYNRFPDSLKHVSRNSLWNLSTHSAGMAVRFRSNSTSISARWNLKYNTRMNHMADTGIKGLDLYCYNDGEWTFVNVARPTGKNNKTTIIKNMSADWREYMLYLPLYDGLDSLYIGVDSLADISLPILELPRRNKPIVFYGTSILQGGCASRPGMAHTNILERMLNVETINLGFSGNAFLDLEVADLMASVDASVYVIDCVPNSTAKQIKERLYDFYKRIRNAHLCTPVIFVEDPQFTYSKFDLLMAEEIRTKNQALREVFYELKAKGETHIVYIELSDFLSKHNEATVDGIHFTDLGFNEFAKLLYKYLYPYTRF